MNTETAPRSLLADRNLQVIFLVTMMSVLGVSSISPALPRISEAMCIPKASIGYLIMAFTFPGIFLTPVLGIAADRWGRKRVLVPALLLFAAAGSACYFAATFQLLLFLRFLQGCGAAALGALNVTLIGDLFSGKERAAAMGYNASVLSLSTASYPFIGGLLSSVNWRLPFLLPALALPVAVAVVLVIESPRPDRSRRMGSYLRDTVVCLKNPAALMLFASGLVVFIMLYGSYLSYTPVLLAERFKASPLQIGLVFSGMSIVNAVTSSQAGKLARRFGEPALVKVSFLFYAAALLSLPLVPRLWVAAGPIAVYGIAQGLNLPAVQSLLTALAPFEVRAAFLSLHGMVLRLGQTLGPLSAGMAYGMFGLRAAMWSGALAAAAMFILFSAQAKTLGGLPEKLVPESGLRRREHQ